jgi:pyridoxine 4-dehydrogenase
MNAKLDAPKSGSFKIGGDIEIYRLGFGAMRLTGPGVMSANDPKQTLLTTGR